MKKHLIVAGISRGGKSTICKQIAESSEYIYMPMDVVVRAFQNCFPKVGITHADRIFNVSKNLAPFLNAMLEDSEENLLIDTYHLVPEDYIKYINKDICEVCFIGYPDISVEQKFMEMRKYEQRQEDIQKTDEELKSKCKRLIDESRYIKEECEKWHLPFLNTSYNRDEVMADYIENLAIQRRRNEHKL